MDTLNLRHYAKFQNDEIVVLGYNKARNEAMICRVLSLPHDEQVALRQIASSIVAQEQNDFLVPLLQSERHVSGADWFTYLANRLKQRDGTVLSIPMKDITDMQPDQKAFFSGYGTTVADSETTPSAAPQARATGAVVAPTPDPTMLAILAQLTETNSKILEKLDAIAPAKKAPVKRRAKKKVVKKPVDKKTTAKKVSADIPEVEIPDAPVAVAVSSDTFAA